MKSHLLIAAIQCGAVAAGYALGRAAADTHRPPVGLSFFAYPVLFAGVVLSAPTSRRAWRLSLAALVWTVAVVGWELPAHEHLWLSPYIFANNTFDLCFAAGCLHPVILLVGPLVRAKAWVTVAGTALFAVGFVALLTYNAHDRGSTAVGFLLTIRD